jgi:tetrahydromethanopterin S-methyltransferase subunit D
LTSSLRWLQGRWLLGSLFGAVGGSLSYVAGARLGALDLPASASLWVIALLWALALPLLSALARRWEMPA